MSPIAISRNQRTSARSLVLIVGLAFLSGCSSSNIAQTKRVYFEPPSDQFVDAILSRGVHRLDLSRPNESDGTDAILLFVSSSFYATVGVSATRTTVSVDGVAKSWHDLDVSVRADADSQYRKIEEVGEFTTVLRRYHAEISADEFERLAAGLSASRVYQQKFSRKDGSLCYDGTAYLFEAKVRDKKNAYTRHFCDPGYTEDFSDTSPLIALAIEKVPMASSYLAKMQNSILAVED